MDGWQQVAPEFELDASELAERLLPELEAYHQVYSPLFQRREQREQSLRYLQGLLSTSPNKSSECMVLHMSGNQPNTIRALQQFIGQGAWDDAAILAQHWREVAQDLGEEEGVLILDGSDFPKQGQESVGVKRQWCGQLGKRANCQAGVFLGYASRKGQTLLHRRLYMPKEWLTQAVYAERRTRCGVPATLTFQTKPQLGLAMLRQVAEAGTLPFRWLTCDEAFGRDREFLAQAAAYVTLFAEVPHDTLVWPQRPATAVPAWSGRGRKPLHARVVPATPTPQTVAALAAALPTSAWSQQTVKEGSKGPLVAEFACLRVVAAHAGLPDPDYWLILRRQPNTSELKTYLSTAPANTPHRTFVWLSGMRWPLETCFEEGKQEIGLGDYQTRTWTGWHHHMTLCILAHFFLVRLRLKLKEEAPALTLPQTILLLQSILPLPNFDATLALDIVLYRQRRNHAAYRSHRKKRLVNSEVSL
jgi:SRSO17 transposase